MLELVTVYNQDDRALGRETCLMAQVGTEGARGQASEHPFKGLIFLFPL